MSHHNSRIRLVDPKKASDQLPVDIYLGGIEHSILHLLYARFMAKFMTDVGILDLEMGEPFKKLIVQGMVLGKTFRDDHGRCFPLSEVDLSNPDAPALTESPNTRLKVSWEKMSKSKFNGVNPQVGCVKSTHMKGPD